MLIAALDNVLLWIIPPCISTGYHLISLTQQFTDYFQLFQSRRISLVSIFGFNLTDNQFERVGNNRQHLLFHMDNAVVLRQGQCQQMAVSSCDGISVPTQVSFLFLRYAQDPGNAACHRGLLTNTNCFHVTFFFNMNDYLIFTLLTFDFSFRTLFFGSLGMESFSFFSDTCMLSVRFGRGISFAGKRLIKSIEIPDIPAFSFT